MVIIEDPTSGPAASTATKSEATTTPNKPPTIKKEELVHKHVAPKDH